MGMYVYTGAAENSVIASNSPPSASIDSSPEQNFGIGLDLLNTPDFVKVEQSSGYYRILFGVQIPLIIHSDLPESWYTLHPVSGEWVEVDPEQLWFWTAEWQARERQAEEDMRLGRYDDFDDLDEFFDLS